ncbi:AT-hook motif nuclear-localized protein 4 [Raphanus sativus]|nr:AT-hook motif nuclear-localized protein 4 [Raphanus sativus]
MGPPRSLNPIPFPAGLPNTTAASASASAVAATASENAAPPFSLTMPVGSSSSDLKMKKRGRPRKQNRDGSPAVTLSPMPISSSVPLTTVFAPPQRGRGRERGQTRVEPPNNNTNWPRNPQMFEFNNSSHVEGSSQIAGSSFTTHFLTVNVGEDVTMKIMKFSQQDSRVICILSANGPVSSVTLRQSLTSAGTLTYEGHFEILSLTGSFITSETGGIRSRAGGMSVSLSGPDGCVFGGALAGLFIAAGPVQVMVGTFEAGQEEPQQQMQNQRRERLGIPTQASNISFRGGSAEDPKARYGLNRPVVIQAPPVSLPHEPNTNAVQGYYTNNTANQIRDLFTSLPGEDDEDFEGEDDDEEFGSDRESDT